MKAKITLQPSGCSFEARDGEAVLDAALRGGLNLPHSCRGGSCRVCIGQLINGSVQHVAGGTLAMRPEELAAGKVMLCRALATSVELTLDVPEILGADAPGIRRTPARVAAMKHLAHDVMALYLRLPPVDPLDFVAGQYIDILLSDGRRRSFSIASPPHIAQPLELHVRLVPGGDFSSRVFEEMAVADLLELEGPLGCFFLRRNSPRPAIAIAGGTGFAPLKSMLLDVFQAGLRQPLRLYWGVRAERDLYERATVERWAEQVDGFTFVPVLSDPPTDAASTWNGRRGFVHEAVLADYASLADFDVYVSGPPPLVDAALASFPAHGLPPERLYVDSFEFAQDVLSRPR